MRTKRYITFHLSTHPFKYTFFGKKIRVQDLVVEHVANCHLALVLKFFEFGFEADPRRGHWQKMYELCAIIYRVPYKNLT